MRLEELEALTRPFDLAAVESARLSRDEEFRSAIGYLWRDWSNRDWMRFAGKAERGNWARGHTARDTKEALVRLASRSGKMDGGGIVFWAGLRRIADMAAKSAPSVSKAVKHLEADGQLEILEPKEAGQARSGPPEGFGRRLRPPERPRMPPRRSRSRRGSGGSRCQRWPGGLRYSRRRFTNGYGSVSLGLRSSGHRPRGFGCRSWSDSRRRGWSVRGLPHARGP